MLSKPLQKLRNRDRTRTEVRREAAPTIQISHQGRGVKRSSLRRLLSAQQSFREQSVSDERESVPAGGKAGGTEGAAALQPDIH